jgi:acetylornithine deacetylase/succinyl-diaminopimelate desuccinylase-like protein
MEFVTREPIGHHPTEGTALWRKRVLDYIDDHAAQIVTSLSDLIRLPSVSGSDEENLIQDLLASELERSELQVDRWQIDLAEVLAADDFPGVEVHRNEAWGVVGRLEGRSDGPSLMLNAHVDVVCILGWVRTRLAVASTRPQSTDVVHAT